MKYIYPTLLKSANREYKISCFDFNMRTNRKYRKRKKRDINIINSTYTSTYKIKLYPNNKQKETLKLWLDDCIDVYNITNQYIKDNVNDTNIQSIVNYYKLRKILYKDLINICKINKLNKHTADYSVKHCVEMYKSALSNHTYLDKFNITDLSKERRRKNLVIEPGSVSSKTNAIFIKQLKEIKSSSPLNLIKRNSILQYDTIKNEFYVIIPMDITVDKEVLQYEKVGIDIGVRTFLTTYSRGESMEIAPDNNKLIDKYNKKKDSIKSNYANKQLSKRKYNKAFIKYWMKGRNCL
jgi:transposase